MPWIEFFEKHVLTLGWRFIIFIKEVTSKSQFIVSKSARGGGGLESCSSKLLKWSCRHNKLILALLYQVLHCIVGSVSCSHLQFVMLRQLKPSRRDWWNQDSPPTRSQTDVSRIHSQLIRCAVFAWTWLPDVPALFFREFSFVRVSGSNAGLLRRENPSYYLIFRKLACSSATSLIFFFFFVFSTATLLCLPFRRKFSILLFSCFVISGRWIGGLCWVFTKHYKL